MNKRSLFGQIGKKITNAFSPPRSLDEANKQAVDHLFRRTRGTKKLAELTEKEVREALPVVINTLGDVLVAAAILKGTIEKGMTGETPTGQDGALARASLHLAASGLRNAVDTIERLQEKYDVHFTAASPEDAEGGDSAGGRDGKAK